MTVEIHNPETESLLRHRVRSGNSSAGTDASPEEEKKQQAIAAAAPDSMEFPGRHDVAALDNGLRKQLSPQGMIVP